jgi:pyruvate,water dikinase
MAVGALFKHWSLRLLSPDRILQQTYQAFKTLLALDGRCHELMAEFESLYHQGRREDWARTRLRYRQLAEAVAGMVSALEQMHPGGIGLLREYFNKYDFYVRLLLAPPERFLIPPFVVDHDQLVDAALVGNKSHHLLQLKHAAKAQIPEGFTITATTSALLIEHNRLRPALDLLLAGIDPASDASLDAVSQALMTLVRQMEIPPQAAEAILEEYDRLAAMSPGGAPRVAVRSSALHEDGAHSFAGQYHSLLGVDRDGLLAAYLEVLASKYTPQALLYRIHAGLCDEEAAMAVLVLVLVDAVASGVLYSRDPAGGEDAALLVHAIRGLGLPLVGGELVPDVFVFAPESDDVSRVLVGSQPRQLVVRHGQIGEEWLDPDTTAALSLTPLQAARLAAVGRELERFFGGPQDIEWTMDREGRLFILQSRPLQREKRTPQRVEDVSDIPIFPLLAGAKRAAGGIAHGMIEQRTDWDGSPLLPGTILVTRHIPPSLLRHIDRLAAVICEQGSVTGHFATVCREFGMVLLVEASHARTLLPQGLEVTVDGYTGRVYAGKVQALLDGQQEPGITECNVRRRLRGLLDHITPLHLLDPQSPEFRPQSCRSLHDIVRYAHEQAVQTMFGLGDLAGSAVSRCRKLATNLPLDIYLLDVGGSIVGEATETVAPEALRAAPFLALWQGLSSPEIDWQSHRHFDWQGFGDLTLSGGIASGGSKDFASYAVVSPDYLNLNMRFGFHFTLIDCLCSSDSRANHCQLRFAGGGGDYQGRSMRIALLRQILGRLGFEVSVRADLLDARLVGCPAGELLDLLVEVGRLLGMTKLLDMVLREEEIESRVHLFFQGADRFHGSATSTNP